MPKTLSDLGDTAAKAKAALKDVVDSLKDQKSMSLELKASSAVKISAAECKKLCNKIGLTFQEGMEERVVQFRFTDATADRHNEVIIPSGVNLKSYKKDPIILLQHDAHSFPIGKSIETVYDKEANDVVGKVLFFDDEIDRTGMAESTFRMVKAGALKNGSIGFTAKPENVRLASPEEKAKFKLDDFGIIFDKIELREFSIVTIPANPNATQISARKGMYTEEALNTLKEAGVSDEHIELLKKGDDPAGDQDPTEENNETDKKSLDTPAEEKPEGEENSEEKSEGISDIKLPITIHVSEKDNVEDMREKLILARSLKQSGHEVNVNMYQEKEAVTNIVEKAGSVLSQKNKDTINRILNSLKDLQKDLKSILQAAEPKEPEPEKSSSTPEEESSKSDQDGEASEALYSCLDNASAKMKALLK